MRGDTRWQCCLGNERHKKPSDNIYNFITSLTAHYKFGQYLILIVNSQYKNLECQKINLVGKDAITPEKGFMHLIL